MKTVNVSGLKNNPSEALRMAHDDMVLVMNRNEPDAVMVGLKSAKIIGMPGVRKAMATALFKDGNLSLARSAKLADMPIASFIAHISRLGISVIDQTAEEVQEDLDTLEQWLKQASVRDK
jgi:predicted HTH domain antitoxin